MNVLSISIKNPDYFAKAALKLYRIMDRIYELFEEINKIERKLYKSIIYGEENNIKSLIEDIKTSQKRYRTLEKGRVMVIERLKRELEKENRVSIKDLNINDLLSLLELYTGMDFKELTIKIKELEKENVILNEKIKEILKNSIKYVENYKLFAYI